MNPTLALLLGLLLGASIAWIVRSLRRSPADARIETELRNQIATQDTELARLRTELTNITAQRSASDTARTAAEATGAELRQAHQQATDRFALEKQSWERDLSSLREQLSKACIEKAASAAELFTERNALEQLRAKERELATEISRLGRDLLTVRQRNGELEAQVRFLNERLATERQQMEGIQAQFRKDFEAISNKLLVDNSTRFNQQSAESLEKLLTPLKETLGQFKTSLETTRTETAAHSAVLKEQISRIGSEAANLSKALKGDVKVLGNWGENMLDQILERSGLQLGVHYRRQGSAKDGEGDQRFLDVIVDLPESRNLVIDSKVSLRSYEEAVNCTEENHRAELLDRLVEAVRAHFRGLGGKRYHDIYGINSPDFVLMYVPIEAAFFSAVAHEPSLFAEALEQNVVLITNSTLLATLRTVAHVWRLADQQKHVLEIAERGGKLYDKFVGFVQDMQEVGKALRNGQDAWEGAWNKLHVGPGNLVRQAEQLKTLGAKAAKALPATLVERAEDQVDLSKALQLPSCSTDSAPPTGSVAQVERQ